MLSVVGFCLRRVWPQWSRPGAATWRFCISSVQRTGDTVTNPFKVLFGLSGMGVAPACVDKPNTGQHHLLIDVNGLLDPCDPIPQDKTQFVRKTAVTTMLLSDHADIEAATAYAHRSSKS